MLAPDAQLGVGRIVGVVRERDHPSGIAARVREQARDGLDDPLGVRIGEGAGHEVIQHVGDHKGLHGGQGSRARQFID